MYTQDISPEVISWRTFILENLVLTLEASWWNQTMYNDTYQQPRLFIVFNTSL